MGNLFCAHTPGKEKLNFLFELDSNKRVMDPAPLLAVSGTTTSHFAIFVSKIVISQPVPRFLQIFATLFIHL